MGNFLSTEEFPDEQEQHGGMMNEERIKLEKKKRRARAKTAKRRAAAAAVAAASAPSYAPPVNIETEGFGFFQDDPEDSLEKKEGRSDIEIREEEGTYPSHVDYDEPATKPKRRKRGGATLSRRKRIAWEEDEEY